MLSPLSRLTSSHALEVERHREAWRLQRGPSSATVPTPKPLG